MQQYRNDKTKNRRRYKSRYRTAHNYKTKQSVKSSRTAIIASVITFLVLACLIVVFVFGDKIYLFLDNSFNHITATKDEATIATQKVETSTKNTVATEATTKVVQQDDFKALCKAADFDYEDSDAEQVIFVQCSGNRCTLSTYEINDDDVFEEVDSGIEGYISENGTASEVGPDDDHTPIGNFNIEYAIGTDPEPEECYLEYHQIENGSQWITDPASINYNKMIDPDATYFDFSYSTDLAQYTKSYKYAIVFDYNRNPVDSTKGCEKFIHVSDDSTVNGGVGISEDDILDLLAWLDPDYSPKVCIFNK